MTPDQLEKLHDQQQSQAAHAAASQKLPAHADISDFADLSRQTMGAVIKGFGSVANEAGSWVDSLPLPLQLMTQPKLTVDLTLATLASDAPFGLSLASLCKLARNGFIYLNLRDYDSDLREWAERSYRAAGQARTTAGRGRRIHRQRRAQGHIRRGNCQTAGEKRPLHTR